jgi:hypothetical protein
MEEEFVFCHVGFGFLYIMQMNFPKGLISNFFVLNFYLSESSMDNRPIKSHPYQCVLLVLTGFIFV